MTLGAQMPELTEEEEDMLDLAAGLEDKCVFTAVVGITVWCAARGWGARYC